MKLLKTAGSAVLFAVALLGIPGSASATAITSATGSVYTGTIHASSEGHVKLANSLASLECNSTFEGSVESHGAETTAKVSLAGFAFTGCTNSWHLTTITPGSLEIHWTNGYSGKVTWSGGKIVTTRFLVSCVLGTENTTVGTVTAGSPATLHIESGIPVILKESSELCGYSDFKWEGSYSFGTPTPLFLDA